MPRLFVAKAKDKYKNVPKKLATGGIAGLKKLLREYPNTDWEITYYEMKANVESICLLATGKLKSSSKQEAAVSATGRVKLT